MTKSVLGIIGGSGIYDLPGLDECARGARREPWGEPSGAAAHRRYRRVAGRVPVASRQGHRLSPSDINYRANIDVLKRAGVTDLVSLSACGSFEEDLPPGTFVLVDQFVDRTHKRESSFFGKGCVAHVSMAHPVSPRLRSHLAAAAEVEGIESHAAAPMCAWKGRNSRRYAESLTYKQLGYSVIGMTNMPEAKLAREAEICYATVAMVTDYDCWHPDHDAVTVQDIIKVLLANAEKAKRLVARLARDFPREHEPCPIGSDRALDTALITAPRRATRSCIKKLDAVAGRVLRTLTAGHLRRSGQMRDTTSRSISICSRDEEWRAGVLTRMRTSAANSATSSACSSNGATRPWAPTHLHAVEEVLCVREGQADVWIDDEHVTLTSGQLVIVPAGRKHGFSNIGQLSCISSRHSRRLCSRRRTTTSARRRVAGCRDQIERKHASQVMAAFFLTQIRPARRDPHDPGLSQARHHVPRHHHPARRCARVPPRGRRTGAALGRHEDRQGRGHRGARLHSRRRGRASGVGGLHPDPQEGQAAAQDA